METNGTLTKVDEIPLGMALDNVSIDGDGVIFAAGFPSIFGLIKAANNPASFDPPSTIWRINKRPHGNGYEATKVLEDARGQVLPGANIAVHDVKTGRFFLSGVTSPFITVCEKRAK